MRLLDDSGLRPRLGAAARELVVDSHGHERMLEQMEALYFRATLAAGR